MHRFQQTAHRRFSSRFSKDGKREGAAMVELAAVLPVFMLTLIGIVEFGRAMSVAQLLNAAAREGCRAAIIDGSTNAEVTSLIKTQVAQTVNCAQASVTVTIQITSNSSGGTISDVSAARPRDLISVDVVVPQADCSYAVSRWLAGRVIRGQCAMRHE